MAFSQISFIGADDVEVAPCDNCQQSVVCLARGSEFDAEVGRSDDDVINGIRIDQSRLQRISAFNSLDCVFTAFDNR